MSEQRDYVMARICAARGALAAASEALDNCAILFVFPDDDKSGKDRRDALEAVTDAAGDISRSIELAQAGMERIDKAGLAEEEPDQEEEDSDDDDDGGD